jgi:hypothetical protein
MSKAAAASKDSGLQTITQLLEISKLDTLYRDLYFQRARTLLEPLLSLSAYRHIKDSLAALDWTERQLKSSVERGDWKKAAELTERIRTTKSSATSSSESLKLGDAVYEDAANVPIDPFSSGFYAFVGGTTETLLSSKNVAVQTLTTLERVDSANKDFYARRRADCQGIPIKAIGGQQQEEKGSKPSELKQEALSALDSGDLSNLERIVQKLLETPAGKEEAKKAVEVTPTEVAELGDDLLYSFSDATLAGARRLGLAPAQTKSRRQFANLIPHGWQPSFLKSERRQWSKDQISRLSYPSETSDKNKEAIEFYLLNAFMTSGGTRYHVCLVVEDLLVEDFAEPAPREETKRSELLTALGLESRRGLTRVDIENALLQRGPDILKNELALNPEAFRLIAIPPDLYSHLGGERGWGQKELWTHFDGYQLRESAKPQALAGGDKRFGGIRDVVSFNPTYTNDRIIVRFAVVQRKRLMSWHKK